MIEKLMFAGLETEAPKGIRYLDVYKDPVIKPDLSFQKYELTDNSIHYGKALYPTIRDLAILNNAKSIEGLLPDFDPDVISGLVAEDTEEADRYLEAILNWLSTTDPDAAYKLAVSIVRKGPGSMRHDRLRSAFLFLLNVRNDETEQLFVDYYVDHDGKEHDDIFDIVNSYWKK